MIWLDGRAQSGDPVVSGAHRFQKVADGVFYATASGTMNVGSNSPIIVTDDEALVIDSAITPAAARALVADLKAVTPKPVRYVVDSHYHYDHAHGNQVFMARRPGHRPRQHAPADARQRARTVHVSAERAAGADAGRVAEGAHREGGRRPAEGRARASGRQLTGVPGTGEGNGRHAPEPDLRQVDDL